MIIRKLGTLNQLLKEHDPTRDDVIVWTKKEVALETETEEGRKTIISIFRHFFPSFDEVFHQPSLAVKFDEIRW